MVCCITQLCSRFNAIYGTKHHIDMLDSISTNFARENTIYRGVRLWSCLISEICKRQLPTHLYVCWDYFYAIDRFDYNDIVKYFSDIWYPSVDDIIIFDDSYKVCMMIRHDGVIYLLNKKPQK